MKLNAMALANASAAVTAVVYVVCAAAIALLPDLSMQIAQSWFHGLAITSLSWKATATSLVVGLLSLTVASWLVGYGFAWTYNYFLKEGK